MNPQEPEAFGSAGVGSEAAGSAELFTHDAEQFPPAPEYLPGDFVPPEWSEAGAAVDDALSDPGGSAYLAEKSVRDGDSRPRSTPPKLDEWQDFFSRVVLRTLTKVYVAYAFRGVDEEELSDREVERLQMTPDERLQVSRPWAEYANKNKFMRKHGRSIVALADSWDSFIVLGIWFSRVNRIASKHRPTTGRAKKPERAQNVDSGSNGTSGTGEAPEFGPGDSGFRVFNPGTS